MIEVWTALKAHNLDQPAERQAGHLALLESVVAPAAEALEHADDTHWVNERLASKLHRELQIYAPVDVAPLRAVPSNPLDARQIGSFAAGFAIFEFVNDRRDPISVATLASWCQDRILPTMWLHPLNDHRSRPAYWRALLLSPGLMTNLTTDYSAYWAGDRRRPLGSFGPQLYLAYMLMSHLVDKSDPGVVKANGAVDKGYLYNRNVPVTKISTAA